MKLENVGEHRVDSASTFENTKLTQVTTFGFESKYIFKLLRLWWC